MLGAVHLVQVDGQEGVQDPALCAAARAVGVGRVAARVAGLLLWGARVPRPRRVPGGPRIPTRS